MTQTIENVSDASVPAALNLLSKGEAEEAGAMLRYLLQQNLGDADAWHAMACVARATGNAQAAVALAGKAIDLRAEAHFHITLGLALLALGHDEPARAAVNIAVLETPRDPQAHQAMAEILEAQGRSADAEQALRNAVRLRPLEAVRHLELASFLARHGKTGDALQVSEKALALAPQDIFTQNQHALLLERAGRMAQAEPFFATVAHALPHDAAALANYGAALFSTGAFEDARTVLRDSLVLNPTAVETRSNLGLVLMALGQLPEAADMLGQAHAEKPDDVRLAVNYGTVLTDLGDVAQAERLFRASMAAEASVQDRARAELNLATVLLGEGRFQEGWRHFEARKQILPAGRDHGLPAWSGESQTTPVLIYAEQGLGDTLQFLRYLIPASLRAPIVLEVPTVLHSLIQASIYGRLPGVSLLEKGQGAEAHGATAACSLLSLPYVLGCDALLAWRETIALPASGESMVSPLKVGMCWAGNPDYRFDRRRSVSPDVLRPLFETEGVMVQSLQKQTEPLSWPISALPEGDMLTTAQILAKQDVVITVDTVIAHLAGLLGKPVWLLDRFGGDWRWKSGSTQVGADGQEHNLWYPSLRVFRQSEPGEGPAPWREPVQRAAASLRALVQQTGV